MENVPQNKEDIWNCHFCNLMVVSCSELIQKLNTKHTE